MCAHHLVVDAVSWSIIVNDLAAALTARLGGTAAVLDSRHTSIATWVASLADRPVPLDDRVHSTRSAGVEADTRTVDVTVDATTTAQLLALATSIDQVLAAAVATAVAQLPNDAGSSLCDAPGQVPITLERHGREATGQLDLSRTVGWLTATAQIHCDPSSDAAVSLAQVRAAAAAKPVDALHDDRVVFAGGRPLLTDTVRLNYLGSTDIPMPTNGPIRSMTGPVGFIGPRNHRTHRLGVLAVIDGGQLRVSIDHDPADLATGVVDDLAELFRAALTTLAEGDTPGDHRAAQFDLAGLDDGGLDDLAALLAGLDG